MEGFYGKTPQYVEILLKKLYQKLQSGNYGQQTKQQIRKFKDHFTRQVIIVGAVAEELEHLLS